MLNDYQLSNQVNIQLIRSRSFVAPRDIELRMLDMTIAVQVFNWAILEKDHRQRAIHPDAVDEILNLGWKVPDSFRSMGIDFSSNLPYYSSVEKDNWLLRDHLDPKKQWAVMTIHTKGKKGGSIPMFKIGGGGVMSTEWTELFPGICLHALAVQKRLNSVSGNRDADSSMRSVSEDGMDQSGNLRQQTDW